MKLFISLVLMFLVLWFAMIALGDQVCERYEITASDEYKATQEYKDLKCD